LNGIDVKKIPEKSHNSKSILVMVDFDNLI